MNRINKLTEIIPENSDCIMITSEINRRYFIGLKSSDGMILCFRDCAYLIIDFRYIETARKSVKSCEIIEQTDLPMQVNMLLKKA